MLAQQIAFFEADGDQDVGSNALRASFMGRNSIHYIMLMALLVSWL